MKKVLLTVLGVFVVIVIVGIVLVYMNKDKLTSMAIEKSFSVMETVVEENSPQNITPEEIKETFSQVTNKLKSGEFDKEKMKVIATTFQSSFQDQKLDSAEVVLIMDQLKDFAKE